MSTVNYTLDFSESGFLNILENERPEHRSRIQLVNGNKVGVATYMKGYSTYKRIEKDGLQVLLLNKRFILNPNQYSQVLLKNKVILYSHG